MLASMWIPNADDLKSDQLSRLIELYGRRSVSLAKLAAMSDEYGFFIPAFGVLPISFSNEVNTLYGEKRPSPEIRHFLSQDPARLEFCKDILPQYMDKFLEYAMAIDPTGKPIIRGSSSEEEYNGLSFAGVCHSSIPKKNYSAIENIFHGVSKVIAGSFSHYADYYFSHHNIPQCGRDVALIFMEMINNPVVHATAYVYPEEIDIRYFLNPTVGAVYSGGYEMNIDLMKNIKAQLKNEAHFFEKEWLKAIEIFKDLCHTFYGKVTPLDIEFLISGEAKHYKIQIVQVRPISEPHLTNYRNSTENDMITSDEDFFLVPASHLYHSIGKVRGTIVKLNRGANENIVQWAINNFSNPIFIVPHNLGEGSFEFLRSLPITPMDPVSVLITHPDCRTHDHLQYSVYEDRRLRVVIHCSNAIDNWVGDECEVEICSTGKQAIIKKE